MTRHILPILALASALSGCSIVGATVSVVRARNANYQRELAIARGDKVIPPKADVGQSGTAGFFAGAVLDGLVAGYVVYAISDSFYVPPPPQSAARR